MNGDPSARMQNTKERPTNASTRSGALPAPPRDLVRDLAAAARRAACFALGGISGGGGAGRTDSGFEPGLTAAGRILPVARPRAMRFVSQPARDGGRCCCAGHSVLASVSETPDGREVQGEWGDRREGSRSMDMFLSAEGRWKLGWRLGCWERRCVQRFSAFLLPPRHRTVPAGSGGLCSRRCRRSYAHGRSLLLAPSPPARPAAAAWQTSERKAMGL